MPTVEAVLPPPEASAPGEGDFRWRSLRYFNAYRLGLASFLIVSAFLYRGSFALGSQDFGLFVWTAAAYWVMAAVFLGLQRHFRPLLGAFLTATVLVDILVLTLLSEASGGYRSGLSFVLLVSLAGAALVGEGRMSLFYAAMASISLLLEQAFRVLGMAGEAGEFSQVGFTSAGFFAVALLMRMLARRVEENERLARHRGIALAREIRVNELVIRDMQDGVLVVDPAGRVRQHNPQAEKLLGVSPGGDASLAGYSPDLAHHLAFGREDAAGSALLFQASGGAVRARFISAGEGGDMIVYLEDQERIQRLAEQVKLVALGRLTAGIAHEIRNPLSAIGHAAELLREEAETGTEARLTRIIGDNVKRMDAMVRDVLELGRRNRAARECILLEAFLRAFVDEFCARERVPLSLVRVDVAPEATLDFDRTHLHQVLWNLMRNGLRHCRRQTGSLRLTAPALSGLGAPGELHVEDDGPGIGAELRQQVFEPFFTTDSKGTGLGLYIARELCEANGAALELGDTGPGAHFVIRGRKEGT